MTTSEASAAARSLLRIRPLRWVGLALLLLSAFPGLPGISLVAHVAFRDQWAAYRPTMGLTLVGAGFLTGTLCIAVAIRRNGELQRKLLGLAAAAVGLSGTLVAGYRGAWGERAVCLDLYTPHKRADQLVLRVAASETLPGLFVGTEHAAIDHATGVARDVGADLAHLHVSCLTHSGWLFMALRDPVVVRAIRGLLDPGFAPVRTLRIADGKLTVLWLEPDLACFVPDALVAARAHTEALLEALEGAMALGTEAAKPKVDAQTVRQAAMSAVVSPATGRHALVATAALVVALAALFGGFYQAATHPTLELTPVLAWSAALTLPIGAVAVGIWARLGKDAPAWFHLAYGCNALLGTGLAAFAVVCWANGALDRSAVQTSPTRLAAKHVVHGSKGRPTYWLDLQSWRAGRQIERVSVKAAFYDALQEGDALQMSTREGALGIPYWTTLDVAVSP